jgi:hypothetical protein
VPGTLNARDDIIVAELTKLLDAKLKLDRINTLISVERNQVPLCRLLSFVI